MRRVILESPFSGDVQRNILYARRALRDSVMRGEAPIASHLLFTQEGVLDDSNPEERMLGMTAGWAWIDHCEAVVVYRDYGVSSGMNAGMREAEIRDIKVEYRKIGENPC